MPGDSNVQAISNVQRIQQRLWLIILFPLPSPADFVQVFYGYLEDLENRQREDFANFFCLRLWIPYTDGGQPRLRAAPGCTAFSVQGEVEGVIIFSPSTACNVCVVSKLRQRGFKGGGGEGRGGRRRKKVNKYLENIYLLEVLLRIDQGIKNADQKGDSWTNVILSKTRHPKFQLLFLVRIKVISSPKINQNRD